jgi:hypothetical protein
MFLLRVLGAICVLIAMVAVVIDAIKNLSVMDGDWIFTSLGDQWSKLSPHSLATVESVVEAHVGPFLWDPIITELLRTPTWEAFGVLGFVLFWLGRKRAPAEIDF